MVNYFFYIADFSQSVNNDCMKQKTKTELLAPAGSIESLTAAIQAGADAVYLGLRVFSARSRAKNFAIGLLPAVVATAHAAQVKVYVTVNTLIKNNELPHLISIIDKVEQSGVDAIIIQDIGVLYILNTFFPQLEIHASTQMGFHNSLAPVFAKQNNLQRLILARELTYTELEKISLNSDVELEIFIHGALCYAFSGFCLFSSYLGGMSANRGSCRQPCRRLYDSKYCFSLKDLELSTKIKSLQKLGIASLKIEGRQKSAEYVYNVTKTYRDLLDDKINISQAKSVLDNDFAREKTEYFMGNSINKSICENPFTGQPCGLVKNIDGTGFTFICTTDLFTHDRLRVMPADGSNSQLIKLKQLKVNGQLAERAQPSDTVYVRTDCSNIRKGEKIFLSGRGNIKFSTDLDKCELRLREIKADKKRNILQQISNPPRKSTPELIVRIDSLTWIRKIFMQDIDYLVINMNKKEWSGVSFSDNFLKKIQKNIVVQLPLFIPESDINFYAGRIDEFIKNGIRNFMISHVSQLSMFNSKQIRIWASEDVYVLNDAAAKYLEKQGVSRYIYPFEDENDNLFRHKNRAGIIALHFFPRLFTSRMPVDSKDTMQDRDQEYKKIVRDGLTNLYPIIPVSVIQYKEKFLAKGFARFLIDLSTYDASKNTFNRLIKHYKNGEAIRPSAGFNYKKGLT